MLANDRCRWPLDLVVELVEPEPSVPPRLRYYVAVGPQHSELRMKRSTERGSDNCAVFWFLFLSWVASRRRALPALLDLATTIASIATTVTITMGGAADVLPVVFPRALHTRFTHHFSHRSVAEQTHRLVTATGLLLRPSKWEKASISRLPFAQNVSSKIMWPKLESISPSLRKIFLFLLRTKLRKDTAFFHFSSDD